MVRSILEPFLTQIRQLKTAEPRIDCADIRLRLNLPVQPEQVRRFCHKHGIPVNRMHAKYGAKHHLWKGGRFVDRDGYVLLHAPDHPHRTRNGYVREHRLVMEAHLGRYLEPSEVVHHEDGNREHNTIENLRVFQSNAKHLQETIAGQVPRWTPDGKRRIAEGARAARRREAIARTASRVTSESGVHP